MAFVRERTCSHATSGVPEGTSFSFVSKPGVAWFAPTFVRRYSRNVVIPIEISFETNDPFLWQRQKTRRPAIKKLIATCDLKRITVYLLRVRDDGVKRRGASLCTAACCCIDGAETKMTLDSFSTKSFRFSLGKLTHSLYYTWYSFSRQAMLSF